MATAVISARMSPGLWLVLVSVVVSVVTHSASGLGEVGGKTEIQGVDGNKEVQDLGRYCVEEFNRKEQEKNGNVAPLVFNRVVEARQQVVSGTKYFLKIETTLSDRTTKMFNSVVVVKPWLQSRELVDFSLVV
ncbi:PREDICTED: cysteine proteinase inhibitor 2-like [Tarenaya hassleriana]|uniref:cysteine proteinase inhibitor 2-like n=1 Tax=Tarenaya hassleriana TaxID=28532 RepID=UPI00053C8F36|nr:PREDICTED: cysteine proteinase inhibitor 2-like [Tarenaya hassleriana]